MTEAGRDRHTEDEAVRRCLESSYVPTLIREARERQDAVLKERFVGKPLAVADVGCGTGYHGSMFGPSCRSYHGFEIAPEIAATARERWREEGLGNAEVFVGDIAEMDLAEGFYDLAVCLYFTPGNIREPSEDLSIYTDAYLDQNPRFVALVSQLLAALRAGGRILLTVYKDVPAAEEAQIDFYEHTAQHVVTPRGSRFVATAEGFWSVRFTRESMLSNLAAAGVARELVSFLDLNEIAWLVEVEKPS